MLYPYWRSQEGGKERRCLVRLACAIHIPSHPSSSSFHDGYDCLIFNCVLSFLSSSPFSALYLIPFSHSFLYKLYPSYGTRIRSHLKVIVIIILSQQLLNLHTTTQSVSSISYPISLAFLWSVILSWLLYSIYLPLPPSRRSGDLQPLKLTTTHPSRRAIQKPDAISSNDLPRNWLK